MLLGACTAEAAGADEEVPPWGSGPLDTYLNFLLGRGGGELSDQELQAQNVARHRQREQYQAACMAEQGFDFIPDVDNPLEGTSFVPESDLEWGSRAWVKRYGLGISTSPWGETPPAVEQRPDPNEELLAAMSVAERDAWHVALWGDPATWDDEFDWRDGGCWGYAAFRAGVFLDTGDENQFAGIQAELDTIFERVDTDPRMLALNAEWASCMTDAGHAGLRSTEDMFDQLQSDWSNLQWQDFDFTGWDWEADGAPDAPEVEAEPAERFRAAEIALALASYDCIVELDFGRRRTEIDHAVQQDFVDDVGCR